MEAISSVLSDYIPDQNEEWMLGEITRSVIASIRDYCSSHSIFASPVLVGSVAKGTNLKGADIDIFIVFERTYREQEMEKLGLEIGRAVLPKGEEKYAEHPYISGVINGIKLDIVPCFRIDPQTKVISSVDRTPLHTDYVINNLSETGKNEVRLLKLLLKHFGIYGSEIRTAGFSGYVCELLVIRFGTFLGVLEYFSNVRGSVRIIDNRSFEFDQRFPVVVQDPTDHSRNAAAAVSMESLARLVIASKLFLKTRDTGLLRPMPPLEPQSLRPSGNKFRIVEMPRPDLVDDIIFSQAMRLRKEVRKSLESGGFLPVNDELAVGEKIEVLVEFQKDSTNGIVKHQGPPVWAENALDFLEKWSESERRYRGPYVQEDRLYVDLKDVVISADEAIRSHIARANIGKHLNHLKDKIVITDPLKTGRRHLVVSKYLQQKIG